MKRRCTVLCLILVLVMLCSQFAFAAELTVTKISPAGGSSGIQPQNMAIKVTFSEDMNDETAIELNANKFTVTDSEGMTASFELVCNVKDNPNELWLLLSETLSENTDYKLTVKPGVKAASGALSSTEIVSTFKTKDSSKDKIWSYILMIVMLVIMFGGTFMATKKEKEEKDTTKAAAMNPYKLSKEKGISLEEANRIVAKAQKKEEARLAKIKANRELELKKREQLTPAEIAKIEAKLDSEDRRAGIQHVHAPASIRKAGHKIPKSVIKKNREKKENRKKK